MASEARKRGFGGFEKLLTAKIAKNGRYGREEKPADRD